MLRVRALVRLSDDVVDAAGKTVADRLASQGFSEVKQVRLGKLIELDLESADKAGALARAATMCERVLANANVEEFEVIDVIELK